MERTYRIDIEIKKYGLDIRKSIIAATQDSPKNLIKETKNSACEALNATAKECGATHISFTPDDVNIVGFYILFELDEQKIMEAKKRKNAEMFTNIINKMRNEKKEGDSIC